MKGLMILNDLETNPLPEKTEDRIEILIELLYLPFMITYDDILAFSPSFAKQYPLDYIRMLLRKYHIYGVNLKEEIIRPEISIENQYLLCLFFKGRGILTKGRDILWQ